MKKLAYILVLIMVLLTLTGCNANQASNPTVVALSTSINLSYIKMFNEEVGWALGSSQPLVLKTTNGGKDWMNVTPLGFPAKSEINGYFLDEKLGWLTVYSPYSSNADLYCTTDGGYNWDKFTIEETILSSRFSFIDHSHGWLLVGRGAAAGYDPVSIYRTDDGGITWIKVSEINTNGPKNGIYFRDNSFGWVTGQQPSGKTVYYVTNDGGQSWNTGSLKSTQEGSDFFVTTNPPVFMDRNKGFFPVNNDTQSKSSTILYKTENGGESWAATKPLDIHANVWAVASNTLWVSDGRILYISADFGQAWVQVTDNIASEEILQLNFIDSHTGWAIGGQGVYKTTDGGTQWVEMSIEVH